MLKNKIVKIATINQIGKANLNQPGVIYCGRGSSQNRTYLQAINLGLGNPFSHKNTENCVWQVNTLQECLTSYRNWLWNLIKNEKCTQNLAAWEVEYLHKFKDFSLNLEQIHTLVCFCVNTDHSALNETYIACHTQILWNAAVWYKTTKPYQAMSSHICLQN